MARDDYFVIVYKILAYLYSVLKTGDDVDLEILDYNSPYININESYFYYIIENLVKDGLIDGVSVKKDTLNNIYVNSFNRIQITPKGIEYLVDNSMMSKVKEFLKDIKAMVPFI